MKHLDYIQMILEADDVLSVKAKLDAKKRGLTHQSHNVWKDKSGQKWKWNTQLKKFEKDTTRRAWNNKLSKIDNFLEYAYDFMSASDKKCKVLHFRRNSGQTAAMMAGIDYSKGEIIIPIDADLQNDPADIPVLVDKLNEGYVVEIDR